MPEDRRVDAADVLVRESSGGQPSAGRRFLANARHHDIPIDHFWMSRRDDDPSPRHACLLVPGAGRTSMVFISTPQSDREILEVGALLESAGAGAPHPMLAQALLDEHERRSRAAFEHAGYTHLATLHYMRRRWRDETPDRSMCRLPSGVEMLHVEHSGDDALARALEASYQDTLDCPQLHGLRRIEDVIESHRSAGVHDPSLWWVVLEDHEPRGALLLNPQGSDQGVELVYLGLAPSLRSRGVASAVFLRGLEAIGDQPNRTLTCAVDASNAPAIEFYTRFGFEPFQSREAYIRSYR
ncbi:MAG: GNAT family N-acetyltransferase [Phycisphaerales bacterium JB043]